jgi:hypothetical protein
MANVARDILPLIIVRWSSLLELSRALFIRSDACRLAPLRRGFFCVRCRISGIATNREPPR